MILINGKNSGKNGKSIIKNGGMTGIKDFKKGKIKMMLEILSYVFVGTFVGNILYDFLKKVLNK